MAKLIFNLRTRILRAWLTAAAAVWLIAGPAAAAGDLPAFHAAVEKAMAHHRVVLGYLRTGNLDLAAIELDRFAEAWRAVTGRFGSSPPDVFKGRQIYLTTMVDISTRIVGASMLIDAGRPEPAREGLVGVRTALAALRKAGGVPVLADCVLDANGAMDAFYAFKEAKPEWAKPGVGADVAARAAAYAAVLTRCDGMAPAAVRTDPEFRRLVDGALASLALVPKAVETRDGDLLFRVLIELRSFDHLLAFRFG